MNGALPPNSIETFLTVSAHCLSRIFPVSVEPVKVNLRTAGLPVNSPPMPRESVPTTILITPLGMPARCGEFDHRQRRQRRLGSRLHDEGAAGGQRGRDLAGAIIRIREIPRRDDGRDDTYRLLQHDDAL